MHSYLLVSLIHLISDVQKHERSIGTAQSCLQMDKRTCKRTIASLHILRDIALVVSYPDCRSFLRGGWSFPAVIRLPSHFIISSPSSRGTPQTGSRSSAPRKKKKPGLAALCGVVSHLSNLLVCFSHQHLPASLPGIYCLIVRVLMMLRCLAQGPFASILTRRAFFSLRLMWLQPG